MTNPFKKKIAVANAGEEELEQMQRTVLTRNETRAEADLLFGEYAKDMRKTDKGLLEKLFLQTPGATTMAPNLQKEASMKLAYALACGPSGQDSWLSQFEGSSLMEQAIALEEQSLQAEQESMEHRMQEDAQYAQRSEQDRARYQKNDRIQMEKRVLALELAKEKAGLGAQQEEVPQEQEAELPPEHQEQQQEEAVPPGMPEPKTASVTARVDAFFEKLSAPSDAQRRYPELLKVADSDTKKALGMKPRVATASTGQTAVRSSLSGGSA